MAHSNWINRSEQNKRNIYQGASGIQKTQSGATPCLTAAGSLYHPQACLQGRGERVVGGTRRDIPGNLAGRERGEYTPQPGSPASSSLHGASHQPNRTESRNAESSLLPLLWAKVPGCRSPEKKSWRSIWRGKEKMLRTLIITLFSRFYWRTPLCSR